MELDNDLETALPCTIYLSVCDKIGIGIPTRLGRLGQFRPCPNCASVAVPTTLTMPLVLGDKVPADISELMQVRILGENRLEHRTHEKNAFFSIYRTSHDSENLALSFPS